MTYEPPNELQGLTDLENAQREIERRMEEYGIHTVYQGKKIKDGVETDEDAIVCIVEAKGHLGVRIRNYRSTPSGIPSDIPKTIFGISTDVVQGMRPHDQRLWLADEEAVRRWTLYKPESAVHQSCLNCPIPGGAQIAPRNANWVGTLGAAIKYKGENRYGLLTNEHVSGLGNVTGKCCQPSGRSGPIGTFDKVGGIRFTGDNYIDAARGSTLMEGGIWGQRTYTVKPEQIGLGPISPKIVTPEVGMTVKKSGRTTGVTTGKIVGVNATSRVGYGQNQVATFKRQVVIEGIGGLFSNSGDSGSLILTMSMEPLGLLFAGGGNQTIANDIALVVDGLGIEFFSLN